MTSKKTALPVVAANWKANGDRKTLCSLLDAFQNSSHKISHPVQCFIAPPSLYIPIILERLGTYTSPTGAAFFQLAGQNCIPQSGAFTGEIDISMLQDFGVETVILGHSERRRIFLETDAVLAIKVEACIRASFVVIACVGETLEERMSGRTAAVVEEQLKVILKACENVRGKGSEEILQRQLIIAYEPVWAIGTGKVATPEQAQEVHQAIRTFVRKNYLPEGETSQKENLLRILYGGSVTAKNAKELYAMPDINGFLVGGASLKPEFIEIIQSTQ